MEAAEMSNVSPLVRTVMSKERPRSWEKDAGSTRARGVCTQIRTKRHKIIGENGGLRELLQQARQIAPLPLTVLISGESGTGKELLAKFLHANSSKGNTPFVTVNCAALPTTLIESELFGHEKGAFTGALCRQKGKFELANGGTLFLDEIGELSPQAQAKLLRVLQEKEMYRVGGTRPVVVDVRVIAATNIDVGRAITERQFREDLYYRLNVVELHCPPLRARIQDLPALARHFVEHYARILGRTGVSISPTALELLAGHAWPGNIRELENVVARAVALATTPVLGPADFSAIQAPSHDLVNAASLEESVTTSFDQLLTLCKLESTDLKDNAWDKITTACERLCLHAMLVRSSSQKQAAEALGLDATKVHRLLRKHGLYKTIVYST